MTDQLHEDLARALEESTYIGAWTLAQLSEWEMRRDELLSRYREAKEGEGWRML